MVYSYDSDGKLIFNPRYALPQALHLPIHSKLAQRRAIARGESVEATERTQSAVWWYDHDLKQGQIEPAETLFRSVNWNSTHGSGKVEEVSPKTIALEPWMTKIEQDTLRFLDEVEEVDEVEEMAEWQHLLGGATESADWHQVLDRIDDSVMFEAIEWERTGEWLVLEHGENSPDLSYRREMSVEDMFATGMVEYV